MTADTTHDPLTGRTFVVRTVAGASVVETPSAVLGFGPDGRVTGRATINRVTGAFRVEGDALVCGPLATTMMAGEPAAMTQERLLLDVLASSPTVRATGSGEVELVTADGATLLVEVEGEEVLL